jgi:hypothetical protein
LPVRRWRLNFIGAAAPSVKRTFIVWAFEMRARKSSARRQRGVTRTPVIDCFAASGVTVGAGVGVAVGAGAAGAWATVSSWRATALFAPSLSVATNVMTLAPGLA